MERFLHANTLALRSLFSGRLFRIFVLSLTLNALCLGALVALVFWAVGTASLPEWLDWLMQWGAGVVSVVIAYFIFPLILPLIISLFDTAIVSAVESQDYPQAPAPAPPYWPTLAQDLRFMLKVIALNLLALPFYLLPVVNIALYYLLNGYLLGNEFFNVVAGKHITHQDALALARRHRLTLMLCGTAITISATIPFINLVAPIWGVVLLTHLFHQLTPPYKALEDRTLEG